ncbi:hypothetical protein [Zavarzinella formosa]|uniref:hypothetical protein n=1 Tax=Zavarzinella formosa TaxID=360055 RepID=UPI0004961288|nr:hypothetical protein [Zavarzinella formosa]
MATGRTPGEFAETCSSMEWLGYVALNDCEPYGPLIENERMGELIEAVYRAGGIPVKPGTFSRSVRPTMRKADARENQAALIAYMTANCPGKAGRAPSA